MGSLFFSEYVEGSSNNKALEIVNTGAAAVSLDGCIIDRYQNGASSPGNPPLELDDVMLGPGQVFVVCHTSFSEASRCDQLSDYVQHSGDDAIVLRCADGPRDVFGRIGEQQVWGTAPTTTRDATLRRKCSVLAGDLDGSNPFDPAVEWDGFPNDTFTDLGQRVCP